jgi:D-glycero-alpha-D-manno-heptose-7-phosphate kinase
MIITRTPLRISFFGGGTDYPEYFLNHGGGSILATGIKTYVYSIFHKVNFINKSSLFNFNKKIFLSYDRDRELHNKKSKINHKVFKACLEYLKIKNSRFEIRSFSDIPALTGLGSSSSFIVSLLHLLHIVKNKEYSFRSPFQLGYEAIEIERKILKSTVGCQDQIMAAIGGFNVVKFSKNNKIFISPISISSSRMKEFEDSLIMVFTGITRKSSDVAKKQINKVNENLKILNEMKEMVNKGRKILESKNTPLIEFGNLLDLSWNLKRKLEDSISSKEIDKLYYKGIKLGAVGGKLLGAGGGGFILFFVPKNRKKDFINGFKKKDLFFPKINSTSSSLIRSL